MASDQRCPHNLVDSEKKHSHVDSNNKIKNIQKQNKQSISLEVLINCVSIYLLFVSSVNNMIEKT